jgi:hypothetical protein
VHSGQGWLFRLQRLIGNSAVIGLVAQRAKVTSGEDDFLNSAGHRLRSDQARAAIGAMTEEQAVTWRASIAALQGTSLDNAYKTMIDAWGRKQLTSFLAARSIGLAVPKTGGGGPPPRPPRTDLEQPAPAPAGPRMPTRPPPEIPTGRTTSPRVPVPSGQELGPARAVPPKVIGTAPSQPEPSPPTLPDATWNDLPGRDRGFLDALWNDLGPSMEGLTREAFEDYWRASAAKLGTDWRRLVAKPFPGPRQAGEDFTKYENDVKQLLDEGQELKDVWGEIPWIYRQTTAFSAVYQLRLYLNALPRYAGEVTQAIPLLDIVGKPALKVGSYEMVRRFRDCLVIYLDGKSLSEAGVKVQKLCEWLRVYQAEPATGRQGTKVGYFADEVPAFTLPAQGLRGVGIGEDPGELAVSFTQVRQRIVESALRGAGGDAATFRKLVLDGFKQENIPAARPWKQWSAKQKSG